ncbi:MAG: NADH-quinone oxidoreductase subunit NuoF [candidate division Zixibacteria bacterium]|nr:NADH-quinone oxidoreductase subunit NuoF [candidate division Zixibacteria bacterium]MCI0595197.1 NADH-quinone oxidoreductase subunit NuoF [candidate division Zixibacteria bacterium]
MAAKVLFKHIDEPKQHQLDTYIRNGGYTALKRALKEIKPAELIEMVKKSGLRGRGGAGFPTGLKWSFVPKDSPKPKYLCVNADESEPGTFKDRQLIEYDPHQVLEGMILSSYAISCHHCYFYIRGEFVFGYQRMAQAIEEAYQKGFLGKNILGSGYDLDVTIIRGGGAYICGEETGLIESLEGKRAFPRVKPPFPAVSGLYNCPTVVNNVETLACVPHIVNRGAEWFAAIGPAKSPGTKVVCLSGHVNKPGNYELEMGTPLRELIYTHGGGILGGRKLKAAIPGGSSVPILTEKQIDVKLDFDSVAAAGSLLGCAAVIVMDERTCMVWMAQRLSEFYEHESCGKCTPCREGTFWLVEILSRIEEGKGTMKDLDLLLSICDNIAFKTVCALADGAAAPVVSAIQHFKDEFVAHIEEKRCPLPHRAFDFDGFVN